MIFSANDLKLKGIELDRAMVDVELANQKKIMSSCIYKLYEMNYLSSGSVFDQSVFAKSLWFEFPECRKYMTSNTTCEIMFTIPMIKYAIIRSKNFLFEEVMTIYIKYIDARSRVDTIERAIDKSRTKTSSSYMLKPNFTVSGDFVDASVLKLNDKAILPCIKRKQKTRLTFVNTSEEVRKALCRALKISDADYEKHQADNKAIFLSGVKFTSELEFIYDIMEGNIVSDTEYGKKITSFNTRLFKAEAEKNMNSKSKSTFAMEGLTSIVFKEALATRIEIARKERELCLGLGGRVLYATRDGIYFETPTNMNYTNEEIIPERLELGLYALDYLEATQFQRANLLLGINGEFISKKDALEEGYIVTGTPFKIHEYTVEKGIPKDNTREMYSISDVFYQEEIENSLGEKMRQSLKPLVGVNGRFNYNLIPITEIYKKYEVSTTTELIKNVSYYAVCSFESMQNNSLYTHLVSELTCALLYSECGYTSYEFVYKRWEGVTSDMLKMAIFDAERTYWAIW